METADEDNNKIVSLATLNNYEKVITIFFIELSCPIAEQMKKRMPKQPSCTNESRLEHQTCTNCIIKDYPESNKNYPRLISHH